MVRPSAKLEENARRDCHSNALDLLQELAKPSATKKDLLIAARVIRLSRAMGVDESLLADHVKTVSGSNKHETDFVAELEALS